MLDYSFTLPDAASTEKWGASLAPLLRRGDVLLLYGDLGMGKTTLSRGLITALCETPPVIVSPTFTLVQSYDTLQGPLFHYDLYRLEEDATAAMVELGWDESLMDGIVLVEWPERLGPLVPQNALTLLIDACPTGGRILNCTYQPDAWPLWQERLDSLPHLDRL